MNQLSAIEQIKAEFQERWGVDVNIELNIHRVEAEKAKRIVEEYAGESFVQSSRGTSWVTNYDESPFEKDYKLTAFIK